VSGSDAALRAAREDAELSARAAQQAAGAPTTVDGFKGHPLYVLQRHITKYQVGSLLASSVIPTYGA
jgi:xeroderma pigmentosum group C-complementing protein